MAGGKDHIEEGTVKLKAVSEPEIMAGTRNRREDLRRVLEESEHNTKFACYLAAYVSGMVAGTRPGKQV